MFLIGAELKDDERLKAILDSLPDVSLKYLEQYKNMMTLMSILIAINSGMAFFSWNLQSNWLILIFMLFSLIYLVFTLVCHHFSQNLMFDHSKSKIISKIAKTRDFAKEYMLENDELGFILKQWENYPKMFKRFNYTVDLTLGANLFLFVLFLITVLQV